MRGFALLVTIILSLLASAASVDALRIDETFAQFHRTDSPGCALGVIQNGGWAYRKAYGMADLEHTVPLTTSSPVYLASVAKHFTAAVIARLEEQNRISLNDSVRKYVSELPTYADRITIRHLLHHTSGLRDYIHLLSLSGRPDNFHTSDDEFLELMVRQRALNFDPGAEHLYSNSNYVLLTIIVKRVTGRTIRAFAQEQLFGPLGMTRTFFADDRHEIIPDRAFGYSSRRGKLYSDSATLDTVGDGGMFGTVDDFLAWDRFLDGALGQRLLERGRTGDGKLLDYALGLVHGELRGVRSAGHAGGFRGYRTHYERYPERKLSVVVLCNHWQANPGLLARRVAALFLGVDAPEMPRLASRPQREPVSVPAAKLAEYAAHYYSDELDVTYRVFVRDGKLMYRIPWETEELKPEGGDRFSGAVRFERDAAGRVSAFTVTTGRARGLRFVRR
jgi:CubicO group peptidase (beta-lactamase class C family)